jgi:hypothetical protein
MAHVRPRVLAILPGFIPSTMITVVKPLVGLHHGGRVSARILLEPQAGRKDIEWAEAIVFCRNAEPRYRPLLAAARTRGVPIIYDMDDDLFALPLHCEGLSQLREASRQAMLEEYVRTASLVRVYSQPLAQRVAELNPSVVHGFAPVDLSLTCPPRHDSRGGSPGEVRGEESVNLSSPSSAIRPSSPRPVRIIYATSRTDDRLCQIFLPALERILAHYANRVEAHFWGYCPSQLIGRANVRQHGLICQYDRFLRHFSRAGFDIGLAPLPGDLFYRSKTNNKFREYGACEIAGIYSNNDVYSSCVEHEVTGMLVANDANEWHDAIVRLIEDEPLRMKIRRNARQYVEAHYAQEKFETLFLEQIIGVLNQTRETAGLETTLNEPALVPTTPGFLPRVSSQLWRSFGTLRRLSPRQTWTALRWFVNDRCLAAWLRWQLRNR